MTTEIPPLARTLTREPLCRLFGSLLAVSLLLHAAAGLYLLRPGRGKGMSAPSAFLDLEMAAPPAVKDAPRQVTPVAAAPESAPAPAPAEETPTPELERLAARTEQARSAAGSEPAAVQRAAIGLGITSGYFGSFADGETLRDDVREYYFELLRRVNEVWWTAGSGHGERLRGASVSIAIGRDGRIAEKVLLQSSGNREFDQGLLQALERAVPLPPLPGSYDGEFFVAPLRFVPPLNLLGTGPKPAH